MQRMLSGYSLTIILVVAVSFSSCKGIQDPVFRGIDKVQIENMQLDLLEISADGHFYNPNSIHLEVLGGNIEIIGNGINLGTVTIHSPSEVPAKENFDVSMRASFPPSALLKDKGGFIGGILSSVIDKKVELEFKGYLDVEIMGISIQVPVEEFEELALKF